MKDSRLPIGPGEMNAGTKHKAADMNEHGKGHDGSLDVCIRVEIDQHDPEGRTEGYGVTIPVLDYKKPPKQEEGRPRTRGSRASSRVSH